MNKVIIGILLITALSIGVITVMADNNPFDSAAHNGIHEPSYDHNHYGNGDETGDHMQLKDGSGAGGMYGSQHGDCNYP